MSKRLQKRGALTMRRWMRRNPWKINFAVFILLLAIVVLLLGFSHAYSWWDGTPPKCFPSFAQAQWPKWIGCAMSKHENLAGGLFGFGGALFAAWVAAQGIFRQMHMDLIKREEDRIEKELPGLRSALEWVNQVRIDLKAASGDVAKIKETITKNSGKALDDTVRRLESEGLLQTTADRWRRNIASDLMLMRSVIPLASEAGGLEEEAKATLLLYGPSREAVVKSATGLDDVASRLEKEIEKLEVRATSLREEIDEFFRE